MVKSPAGRAGQGKVKFRSCMIVGAVQQARRKQEQSKQEIVLRNYPGIRTDQHTMQVATQVILSDIRIVFVKQAVINAPMQMILCRIYCVRQWFKNWFWDVAYCLIKHVGMRRNLRFPAAHAGRG